MVREKLGTHSLEQRSGEMNEVQIVGWPNVLRYKFTSRLLLEKTVCGLIIIHETLAKISKVTLHCISTAEFGTSLDFEYLMSSGVSMTEGMGVNLFFFSLKHVGRLSHSCIKARHSSVFILYFQTI